MEVGVGGGRRMRACIILGQDPCVGLAGPTNLLRIS